MNKHEVSAMASAAALTAFARWWKVFSHRLDLCKCNRLFFVVTPCEIRLEEMAEERRQWLWSQWDGLGLGYIGPRLVNGKEA